MNFNRRGGIGIDGGLRTQIHHRSQFLADAVQLCPGGVDTKSRQGLATINPEVGRGPSQRFPQTPAPHHETVEPVRPCQKQSCGLEISLFEGLTDPAAAHPPFGILDDVDNANIHASCRRHPLQQCRISSPLVTEAEVRPYRDALRLKRIKQHGFNERLRAEAGELSGERHQHQLLNPKRFEQGELLFWKIQPQSRFAEQHFAGVGPEAHDRGNGQLWPFFHGPPDHSAMASVKPIEASQRQGGGLAGVLRRAERDQRGCRPDASVPSLND